MNRRLLRRLEETLAPAPSRIRAALAWRGVVRAVLIGAVAQFAPEGMTTADLPQDCEVFESDPAAEAAMLYLSTDGRPSCQRVVGIDLETVVGRKLLRNAGRGTDR